MLDSVNMNSIVEDVEQIRLKLGLEKPLIMGHSIHGTVATEYVKNMPIKFPALSSSAHPASGAMQLMKQKPKLFGKQPLQEEKKLQEDNWGKLKKSTV